MDSTIVNNVTETNTAAADVDVERAAATAAGLLDLAAMLTEHPRLATKLCSALSRLLVAVVSDDAREQVCRFAQAGLASGATVTEHDNGKYAGVDVAFGPVTLHVYADVEKVHDVTRIVEYTPRSILAEIANEAAA